MTKQDIKQFVQQWMDAHEPDTFIKDESGNYMYRAGSVSLNLKWYFEMLLQDFVEENNPFINSNTKPL